MENSQGVTACAQCAGVNCAQASCNLSCEYGSNWCLTIVSGFMQGEMKTDPQDTKPLPLFTGVPGVSLRSVRTDLAALGVQIGDVLTHINNEYIGGDIERLASLTGALTKGTQLVFYRGDERMEVVL